MSAARAIDAAGYRIMDARSPYPIEGLPLGPVAESSRIARTSLGGGVLGAVGGFALQAWTSGVSWPLDVGGKPLLAWLAYVPVAFELMILGAGTGAVGMFLVESGLYPRPGSSRAAKLVTTRCFVLEVESAGDARGGYARQILVEAGAATIEESSYRGGPAATPPGPAQRSQWLDWALFALTCVAVGLTILLWPDSARRNFAFAPDMADSPAATTYTSSAAYPHSQTPRIPVQGTVPRGPLPLRFEATEAEALRAAAELHVPADIATETDPARAEKSFASFCQPCHGSDGHGDGITIKRGFQPPPSLLTQQARDMKDGQMFHVITYGQKLMPSHATQVSVDDRWRLIMHVRRLQQRLAVDPPPFGSPVAPEPAAP